MKAQPADKRNDIPESSVNAGCRVLDELIDDAEVAPDETTQEEPRRTKQGNQRRATKPASKKTRPK